MKKNIILIVVFLSFSCLAQTNELTVEEFSSIKFNNVLVTDIYETKGDDEQVKSLLDTSFITETGDEPSYWKKFTSTSYEIIFKDGESNSGVIEDYQLTDISILSSVIEITIKGIDIKIGDNISVLGVANVLTYSDGRKGIVYKLGAQVVQIGYDSTTGIINKIKYVYYNT